MKQKFSISRNAGGEKVVIREYAELDKGIFSQLCEVSYDLEAVTAALEQGPYKVIALLRSESFFPTCHFAEKLTASLKEFVRQGGGDPVKIDADDYECIRSKTLPDAETEESGSIDALLDVEGEDLIEDVQPVDKLDAPIKIAEDETAEISTSL